MSTLTTRHYFHDESAAIAHLEGLLWGKGVICPHCGIIDQAGRLEGVKDKKGYIRLGLWKCYACRKQFTVKVGTVFESAHIPLHKMLQAVYLLCSSKKGCSSHQLHRTLEITYKSAWFLSHRIREAMRDGSLAPMGGAGAIVEIDETIIGRVQGAPKRIKRGHHTSWRNVVLTLVERGGSARSFHVGDATMASLLPIIRVNINRETSLMTDEWQVYTRLGQEFGSHEAVNHSKKEYVRRDFTFSDGALHTQKIHTNTVEGYYSIFKRGMKGVYQHCKEKHLHRYLAEFDFRYSYRVKLGYDDQARAGSGVKGHRW
jgi:transposase-like protein